MRIGAHEGRIQKERLVQPSTIELARIGVAFGQKHRAALGRPAVAVVADGLQAINDGIVVEALVMPHDAMVGGHYVGHGVVGGQAVEVEELGYRREAAPKLLHERMRPLELRAERGRSLYFAFAEGLDGGGGDMPLRVIHIVGDGADALQLLPVRAPVARLAETHDGAFAPLLGLYQLFLKMLLVSVHAERFAIQAQLHKIVARGQYPLFLPQ